MAGAYPGRPAELGEKLIAGEGDVHGCYNYKCLRIIQDCDLNPYEAANLVNQTFTHGGILLERTEFQKVMVFQNDGRTNLLFPFFQVNLEMGKLVMGKF